MTEDAAVSDRSDWQTYKRLLGYVAPYWPIFLLAVAGFALGNGAAVYFTWLFGDIVDSWGGEPDYSLPALMVAAVLASSVGAITGELFLSQISFGVVHNIRTQLFNQLVNMPSAYFDGSQQGHLVSRITFNVSQLRDTGTDALKTIVQDGVLVIYILAALLYLSWQLTLVFMVTAPVVALVVAAASQRFRRISRRIQNSMGDVTHVSSEMVSGYRVVRIFGGEQYEKDRFNRASAYNRRQNLKMVLTKIASTQLIQIFVVVAIAVLIAILYQPEVGGGMSAGDVVKFLGLSGMLVRPIRKLTEINAKLQRGLAAAEDVFSQLDESVEVDAGTRTLDAVAGHIEFRNVSFTYAEGKGPVLDGVSFIAEPGQTVALVGRSGSGKSTLASLIPRFYLPEEGAILLDGVDVREYQLQSLRDQIALVTQQVTLFNDTLERNIAYGSLADADADEIAKAVRGAHVDAFVDELADGLNTVVGDDGVLLSGGQRQRVAIARAILKDAPILILDEATSALDTESERHIQQALETMIEGRTTLVIAHRLSTIENADLILVLENGRVVERGDHETLLAAGGAYTALYRAQFADEHNGAEPPVPRPPVGKPPRRLPQIKLERPLVNGWYSGAWWTTLLAPLGWIVAAVARRRRRKATQPGRERWRAPVPVIVVGNITVGGTGKSPFVIWLVGRLRALGYRPGVVMRGYHGAGPFPVSVTPRTEPDLAGDEAPMLAARCGCPVVADPDRVAAVDALLANHECDIVVSDDGLQHHALTRDIEIVVLDGHRGLGNGRCIPAGPLREPADRISGVDWVIANGKSSGLNERETVVRAVPMRLVNVATSAAVDWRDFAAAHPVVHAVAGLGHPQRFGLTLREMGMTPSLHPFPDHHQYDADDVRFGDDLPVVVTEKDAVKLRRLPDRGDMTQVWCLEIELLVPAAADDLLANLLRDRGLLMPRQRVRPAIETPATDASIAATGESNG